MVAIEGEYWLAACQANAASELELCASLIPVGDPVPEKTMGKITSPGKRDASNTLLLTPYSPTM
jgi:hypothetical protein